MKFLVTLSVALFAVASANPVTTPHTHLPGGLHPIDVKEAHFLEIIAETETKINAQLNSTYYHKILKVLSAESQVVAGIMYHVKFEIAQTQCLKEKVTKETIAHCDAFSDIQACEARILSQPWMAILDLTELKCTPKEANHEAIHTGGLHKIDVHDAELLQTLFDAQPMINDKLNSPYYHRIGKVIEAEAQTVAGVKFHVTFELGQTQCLKEKVTKDNLNSCDAFTHIQVCKAQIWSQPWLHHTEITEIKCEARKEVTFYSSVANELPGGHHKMDVNDAELKKTMTEVEPQINNKLDSIMYYRVGRVIEAESQVVSGVIYHVTFEIGMTQCMKEKVTKENLATCDDFSHVQVCKAKIWVQSWLKHTEIMEVTCKPVEATHHPLPGGKIVIAVDNKEMRAALSTVESRMSNQLNSPFVHTVTKVTEATSQIVSGVLYHVSFEFGQTKCMKSHPDLEGCRVVTLSHHCHADILVQSWLKNIELHKFHCDN